MEYVIFKLLLFAAALVDGVYLGVLFHELGHAAVALLATRQTVGIRVGTGERPVRMSIGRLSLALGLAGFRYGATTYGRERESVRNQRLIILGGPSASLLATALFGASLWFFEPWSWLWVVLLAFFVANIRILIVSVWPIEYPAPDGSGDVWLSDGLDFWRMGKR